MEKTFIRDKLLEVLAKVQELSGEPCPTLTDKMRPIECLPEFTSKVWPVAAGMLGQSLGRAIPCDENIFVNAATKEPLSIAQSVELVWQILQIETSVPMAAE